MFSRIVSWVEHILTLSLGAVVKCLGSDSAHTSLTDLKYVMQDSPVPTHTIYNDTQYTTLWGYKEAILHATFTYMPYFTSNLNM